MHFHLVQFRSTVLLESKNVLFLREVFVLLFLFLFFLKAWVGNKEPKWKDEIQLIVKYDLSPNAFAGIRELKVSQIYAFFNVEQKRKTTLYLVTQFRDLSSRNV